MATPAAQIHRPVATTAPPEGTAVQTMETPYATAVTVQRPRDLNEVERLCLEEASKAGESIFYAWGAGKDRIEGPSVDCAMIAARNWGNCAVPAGPMIETPSAYIFTASFVDLERGYTIDRQFRQSKNWKVFGKMDDERKADIRFQIGASKAARNVILKALPAWLIDHMMDRAKQGVREKIAAYIKTDGIVKAREMTMRALAKSGVTEERIAAKFGKKMCEWEVEDLVILKGTISAIESGQESAEAIFPDAKAEETAPGVTATAGDPTTNTGHENAPKPENDPAKEQVMREEIQTTLRELNGGDFIKADNHLNAMMQTLNFPVSMVIEKCTGDKLLMLHSAVMDDKKRAAAHVKS